MINSPPHTQKCSN